MNTDTTLAAMLIVSATASCRASKPVGGVIGFGGGRKRIYRTQHRPYFDTNHCSQVRYGVDEMGNELVDKNVEKFAGFWEAKSFRTFVDKTGKFSVEARMLQVRRGKVKLYKRDAKTVKVSLAKLSREDSKWVRKYYPYFDADFVEAEPAASQPKERIRRGDDEDVRQNAISELPNDSSMQQFLYKNQLAAKTIENRIAGQ